MYASVCRPSLIWYLFNYILGAAIPPQEFLKNALTWDRTLDTEEGGEIERENFMISQQKLASMGRILLENGGR